MILGPHLVNAAKAAGFKCRLIAAECSGLASHYRLKLACFATRGAALEYRLVTYREGAHSLRNSEINRAKRADVPGDERGD